MLRIWIVLSILCLMLLSCSDDSNPSEPAAERFTITINALPDTVRGIVGTTQEVSFYVDLKRDDETVVEGQTVNFTDATGIGIVTPDEAVTNDVGEVMAVFTVEMPTEQTTSRIIVEANNITKTKSITLIPTRRPDRTFSLEAMCPVLSIEYNSARETQITATVVCEDGLAIPGIHLAFSVNPDSIGSVISTAVTDSSGRAKSTFRTNDRIGIAEITARVDEPGLIEDITAHTRIEIRRKTFADIDIQLSEDEFYISQVSPWDTTYTSTVSAIVTDSTGYEVRSSSRIEFSTTHGRISDGFLFFNPERDMDDNDSLTISIRARIPDYPLEGNSDILVRVLNDRPISTLSADRYAIQADGAGGSQANLSISLATPGGLPVPGKEIIFRGSGNCIIQSPILTDSMGIATALFDDIGESGLVSVFAESEYGNSDTIEIQIQQHWAEVASIDLFIENTTYDPSQLDSTKVRAICYLENGLPVPGGNTVRFEAQHGHISSGHVTIDDRNGSAETYYIPRHAGPDSLYAYVYNLQNTVQSDTILVNVLAGPPARLRLQADPEELNVNDPNAISLITATVLDDDGYPIRIGTRVNFEATLGHIGETSYTIETGEAFVFYYPSMFAGEAVLTATVESGSDSVSGQTIINMIPGAPNSIELDCDPLFVDATGHRHSATLRATVRDANENLIQVRTPVVFEMINEPEPPAGCTIGNERDQSFVSYSFSGVAVASLNPGEQIGGKLIRAYTWRDSAARPNDIVTDTFSSFSVISGPPFQLDIGVDNEGEDVGGGAWALEVSARVWDIHRNPVADRLPVVFTVEPEIANISVGWTGNENSNGESVPGLAFATLIYNSINSFEEIEITGEVQTERGMILGSWEFILPVQDGVLTLEEPNGDFIFDEEDDILEAQFIARLIDGHQIRIEDAPFVFLTDLGAFDPEQPGLWRASQEDIFFNPEINEQVVTFRVRVDGTDITSESLEVLVRRR